MELHRCWLRVAHYQKQGEWWLRVADEWSCLDPWRALITRPDKQGIRRLEMWSTRSWELYAESTNLKALKAIGRIEAARRFHG